MQIISNREKEVLLLIAFEYTSKEIAQKLCISQYTVDTHRKNIIGKMEAKNTAGIVRKGFEWGLLPCSVCQDNEMHSNIRSL